MAAASTIWGLSPLFYKPLEHVPPGEVMSHRVVWSFVIFGFVLAVQGRFRLVFASLTGSLKNFGLAAIAALMIATNWFFWIYAVLTERTTHASLGYFIFPLVAVLIGVAVFRERLAPAQKAAVAIAAAGVLVPLDVHPTLRYPNLPQLRERVFRPLPQVARPTQQPKVPQRISPLLALRLLVVNLQVVRMMRHPPTTQAGIPVHLE